MRAVVQRVRQAKVLVDERMVGAIGIGLLVFVGVGSDDNSAAAESLAEKITNLRVFDDEQGWMNRSLLEVGGEALVVSEFTLYGDCRKGRRPNYIRAAQPEKARELYQAFVESLKRLGLRVATGEFQAMMRVELTNDGPVTLLLDSERSF